MKAKREVFALAAIPILVATIIWLPPWGFLVILGLAATIACDEMLEMARNAGFSAGRWLPLGLVAALLAASWAEGIVGLSIAVMAVLVILPTSRLAHKNSPEGSFAGVSAETFTVLYLGVTAACLGWIRLWPADHSGIRWLFFYLACIWVGDSGAYYIGKNFGRHKMSPKISPNKTMEGLAGCVLTTYAAAAVAAAVLDLGVSWVHIFGLATILGLAAPIGDLVESQFKRDTGVKDSSSLIPGHGGFLDRTDSLFYGAPVFLGYLVITGLL
jgi:phosphatidate cytidylyltransferase